MGGSCAAPPCRRACQPPLPPVSTSPFSSLLLQADKGFLVALKGAQAGAKLADDEASALVKEVGWGCIRLGSSWLFLLAGWLAGGLYCVVRLLLAGCCLWLQPKRRRGPPRGASCQTPRRPAAPPPQAARARVESLLEAAVQCTKQRSRVRDYTGAGAGGRALGSFICFVGKEAVPGGGAGARAHSAVVSSSARHCLHTAPAGGVR